MSKKKGSSKAPSKDEKVQEFIGRLRQYDDFRRFFTKDVAFLQMLPRNFPLKLGASAVGTVTVDWKAVFKTQISVSAVMSKPDDLSHEEWDKHMMDAFTSLSPKAKDELMMSFYSVLFHMMEFMPEKLTAAVTHLALEGRQQMLIKRQKRLGSQNIPSPAKFAAWVAKVEEEATKKRLPEVRGGSDPDVDVSDEQCAKLSADYPALHQHWKNVKKWQKEGPNWRSHAKVDQPDTPDDLLDRLSDPDPYRRQPSTIAHEHAARRCGIPADAYGLSTHSRLRRRGEQIRGQSKSQD